MEATEFVFEAIAAPLAADASQANGGGTSLHVVLGGETMPLSVRVDAGMPC